MGERPEDSPQSAPAAADLVMRASIEVSARELRRSADVAVPLLAGRETFLPWTPNLDADAMVEATLLAKRLGLAPVPHVAARRLASEVQARDLLQRLASSGAEAVLLIGGDVSEPAGPYGSSLDLLSAGLLQASGLRRFGVAGYPEGHPSISDETLLDHLKRKLDYARDSRLEAFILSQFCFEGRAIVRWIGALRNGGVEVPIRIGVAGPTNLAKLLELGLRCGVGNSIRALRGLTGSVFRMIAPHEPGDLIREIAAARIAGPRPDSVSMHLFAFGGVSMTAKWMRKAMQSSLEPDSPTSGVRTGG
jgi:methylenetetrahydrofolate reductase (NADPH)